MFSQWLFLVQIEFIFSCPKPATCLACFSEVLLRSQTFSRIFLFGSEQIGLRSNHLWRLAESSLVGLLRDASPFTSLFTIHNIVHWLTSEVVLGKFRTIYWPSSLAIHCCMNSATASTRIRNISRLITSLSYSSSWRWVIHSALGPNPVIDWIDFIFMQADVLNILPKCIYVTIGVKSSEVSCCLLLLFRDISRCIRHVRPVRSEVTAAKYRTFLLMGSGLSEVLVLGIFSGRSERVGSFESSWWLHDSSSLSRWHFNCSPGGEGRRLHHILWIWRAVEVVDEFLSTTLVFHTSLVWGSHSLVKAPIVGSNSADFGRCKAICILLTLGTF